MSNTEENRQIAATITDQLGGNQFLVLCGIKKIVVGNRTATFHLPRNAKHVTAFKVTLDWDDTYTVETYCVRKARIIPLDKQSNVYCDVLQDHFEAMTELYTTLFARR